MLWAALLLAPKPTDSPPIEPRTEPRSEPTLEATQRAVATWALQFTPRVSLAVDAVLMEVLASTRLFGGKRALRDRVWTQGQELGVVQLGWGPTSLAALALARAGIENGFKKPLQTMLDALPMGTLSAVAPHHLSLAHIGCRTLGDIRALPRGGLSRRFDKHLLLALDQAYGLQPEVHEWVTAPEQFQEKLELMARVESAPALLFGARRLLLQMAGWLAARHCGVSAFTLRWAHDSLRAKAAGVGGELTLRTAEPTRDIEHLGRLLAEHLARTELLAAVGELELVALEVQRLECASGSLFMASDAAHPGESSASLQQVLERVAARLGPQRVLRPVVRADHRLDAMCQWHASQTPPAAPSAAPSVAQSVAKGTAKKTNPCTHLPQPTFVLNEPLKLVVRSNRPCFQGPLQLLAGPQRIEGGWWDREGDGNGVSEDGAPSRQEVRDYWVALSRHAGLLWVFQTRLSDSLGGTVRAESGPMGPSADCAGSAWFLHGHFG